MYDPLRSVNEIEAALRHRNASTLAAYLRWTPQQLVAHFYQLVVVKGVIANRAELDLNRNFEFGFNTFELNPMLRMNPPYRWPKRAHLG